MDWPKAGLEHRYERLLKLFARFRSVVRKAPAEVQEADAEEFAAMGETLDTLQERLDAFSQSVTMIKRIADQLELLGVNATIQAAHAGEKGKGFLIVADETISREGHFLFYPSQLGTLTRIQRTDHQQHRAMRRPHDNAGSGLSRPERSGS